MPQTSPMNWFLFSNLVLLMINTNSIFFSFNQFFNLNNNKSIDFFMKKWKW